MSPHRSHIVLVLCGGRISRLRLPHWSHSTIAPLVKHSSCAQFLLPSHLQASALYRLIFVPGSRRSKHMLQCASLGIGALRGVRFGFLLGDGALPPKYARARPKWAPALFVSPYLVYRLDQSKWACARWSGLCPATGIVFYNIGSRFFLRRHNRAIDRGPVGASFFGPFPSHVAKFPLAVETLANWSTLGPHKKESICTQRGSNPRPCR